MTQLIDVTKVTNKDYHFLDCVGSGRIDLALREDYRAALRQVQADIGFTYLRAHGIFSKQMAVYRQYEQDGQTKVVYNFTYLDQCFDFFQSVHIKPFLELGFMPEDLASGENTVFWWEGNVTPPKDYGQWTALVQATLQHLIQRYGRQEVLTWPVEVWNEPNLTGFWKDADQPAYFELYRQTAAAVKAVDPQLRVGGPVICGGSDWWMKDFLEFCKQTDQPLDFISRHAYSVGPTEYDGLLCTQEVFPSQSLLDDFAMGHEYLQKYYGRQLPVYVSEFNTSYTPDNPIHDGAFNAAYLAPVLAQGSDLCESFSYWTFCDVFEEKGVPASFLHGGFGLMTQRQIKKPTYYLYQFFAQLSSRELYRDDHCLVGYGKDDSLVVIVWNSETATCPVELTLSGLESSAWYQQTQLVDDQHGNIDTAWRAMGRPRFPTANELAVLQTASQPATNIHAVMAVDGQVDIKLDLAANAICLLKLTPQSQDESTY